MLPTLTAIIAVPFVGAALALSLSERWSGRVALLPPAIVLALALPLWPEASAGVTTLVPVPWFPSLGMTASMRLDHLGAFFVLLVAGIGLGIVQYSRAYFGAHGTPRFWAALLAFMGAMLGVVLSDSLLLLLVFWELTTIASALLIGMDFTEPEARSGAIRAFLVTGFGGLSMLAGAALLGQMEGTYDLSALASRADTIVASPSHYVPLLLLLTGAFAKSAQFPFHFWLPDAMAAPPPVSAYLHSATMVKAGVLLIGRLHPIFGESPAWRPVLTFIGLTTLVVSGWDAVRAWDLKKLLAHSTAANIGILTALYGLAARGEPRGELVGIANHALYKSALFLLVGWMEKVTGTRDLVILRLEHWFQREPIGGVLIGIGALAMAGAPLLFGFLIKEALFEALLPVRHPGAPIAIAAAVLGGAMAITYALKLFVSTFWGPDLPPEERGQPRRGISNWMLVVPAVFLLPQVIGGIAPGWLAGSVIEPGTAWPAWIAVWHHVDAVFALSALTIALGLGGYLVWRRRARPPRPLETERTFDRAAAAVLASSAWVGRAAQAGAHPRYVVVTLLSAAAAAVAAAFSGGAPPTWRVGSHATDLAAAWLPTAVVAAGAVVTVVAPSRVTKVVALAIAGYGMALFYILFRAPDLALTQILVETISLVLLLLVFRRLPGLARDERSRGRRVAHALAAGAVALGAAALAWVSGASRGGLEAASGAEQLAMAMPEAEGAANAEPRPTSRGRNVVNVILVDFRSADTLGEITVLATAAIGVVALLHARRSSARRRGRR